MKFKKAVESSTEVKSIPHTDGVVTPKPVLATSFNPTPVYNAPAHGLPYNERDYHAACVLGALELLFNKRKRSTEDKSIPVDYAPAPSWGLVPGSSWRGCPSFEAIAKRARGGTMMAGPTWAEGDAFLAKTAGLTLAQRMELLVLSTLDGDPLVATVAVMLGEG